MKDMIANMKKAARDRALTEIGGGVFAPAEVEQAARLLEAVPALVDALESIVCHERDNIANPYRLEAARAALAKVEG